MIHKALLRD